MSVPIYYIKNGSLSFADKVIFEDLELYIYPGDRICLIGRNGSGKSSLMKVINGDYELDDGDIFHDSRSKISYLIQENVIHSSKSIYQFILGDKFSEEEKYQADIVLENLQIPLDTPINKFSGGQVKRLMLARSLVEQPEILLLDEPTNHLDIATIEWLEGYVNQYQGAIICISHDRSFLQNTTNKVWWIDRGCVRKSDKGFKFFDEWQEEVLQYEESVLRKLDKKMQQENIWLNQGVTARRKRNQKRLSNLMRLREQMRAHKAHIAKNKRKIEDIELDEAKKSKFIIKAENISYEIDNKKLINDFSIEVQKGEKIGIIGPNGVGKTTLINLLLGTLNPTEGKIRRGKTIDVTYFDQHRSAINPKHTLQQFLCPNGGDQVFLQNKTMHVAGYLKQFLFDPKLAFAKIGILSGGERGRLLLAKSLINPGNVLVLDEPTNDLDMDSLETLLEILSDYQGTLIVVSHDRDFLDKLVTRTLVFDDSGGLVDFIGGYEDYQKFHKRKNVLPSKTSSKKSLNEGKDNIRAKAPAKKLSYNLQRKLELLPKQVEELEAKISDYETQLADSELFAKNPENFARITSDYNQAKIDIEALQEEWIEIAEQDAKLRS